MLIKDIKNDEVRGRAIELALITNGTDYQIHSKQDALESEIGDAFWWSAQTEGIYFWNEIDNGEDLPLPKEK